MKSRVGAVVRRPGTLPRQWAALRPALEGTAASITTHKVGNSTLCCWNKQVAAIYQL